MIPFMLMFLFGHRYARTGIVQVSEHDIGEQWKENPRLLSPESERWLKSTQKLGERD